MAFRNKAGHILKYHPDIIVVPECEHPDKLKFQPGMPIPTDIFWHGSNLNKGLGVFSYTGYKFRLLDVHNPRLRMILPLEVTGDKANFTLFAIWANNPEEPTHQYVGQVWKAIHEYDSILQNERIILAGDFNSNTIWDKPKREGNHSTVVEKLAGKGINSVYHHFHNQLQGKEQHPTWYLYRHKNKPYHLDYCFASADFIANLKGVEIGSHDNWAQYSDHVPLIVTFEV